MDLISVALDKPRREWVESQGRSAFIEIKAPENAVRFKQQQGSLLRTTDDITTVSELDGRLATKRRGGLLMRGLPEFQIVVEPRPKPDNPRRASQVAT